MNHKHKYAGKQEFWLLTVANGKKISKITKLFLLIKCKILRNEKQYAKVLTKMFHLNWISYKGLCVGVTNHPALV